MSGPLAGIRVVELAGLGPAPFGCMVLADLGAEVLRVDRPGGTPRGRPHELEFLNRGRTSVVIDLKTPEGRQAVVDLAARADVFVEGFRPGVAERLGLGPDELTDRAPGLVYARMTGWGQDGPLAQTAGHDINYIAIAGALGAIGPRGGAPVPPLNLVGDFGGGGMLLVAGVLAALVERAASGRGQVVDVAMVDGVALLMTMIHGFRAAGRWRDERGTNLLDGGAPFYTTYACADGGWIAVGAIEPPFYAALVRGLAEVDPDDAAQLVDRDDPERWPELEAQLAEIFRKRTRDDWVRRFDGTDACVSPVLQFGELESNSHLSSRATYLGGPGWVQPAPAPRFSRTAPARPSPPEVPGASTERALREWGFDTDRLAALRSAGAIF